MILYYTGTGNSRIIAEKLAEEIGDEIIDAFDAIRGGRRETYASDRAWVFVCPTYGWRLPRIFEEHIRRCEFSGSRDAYFVMTCGSEIGNAEEYIRGLCAEKGLVFRGVKQIVMPENYTAMFAVPDQQELERIIASALPEAVKTAGYISASADIPAQTVGFIDRIKSGVVNGAFYSMCVSSRGFRVSEGCIGCGLCAKLCPCGGITLVGGRPQWGRECTHCMACINACPAKAIEYKRASEGKPRIYNGKAR